MAVIEEHPYIDESGEPYFDKVRHYSDDGKQIVQIETGKVYDEAVDLWPCLFHYEEERIDALVAEATVEEEDSMGGTDYDA